MAGPGSPYFLFKFNLFTTYFLCVEGTWFWYNKHGTDKQHNRISHKDFQGPWASYMLYIVPVNIGPFPLFHRSSMGSVSQYWFRYEASVLSILVMRWPAYGENRACSHALDMSWFCLSVVYSSVRKSEVSHIQSEYRTYCNCWIVTAVFLGSKWDMDRCVI